MPWNKIADVPDNLKMIDGVPLRLRQVNAIAAMADAIIESGQSEDIAWGTAIKKWKEHHEVAGDSWVLTMGRNGYEGMYKMPVGVQFDGDFRTFDDCKTWINDNGIDYFEHGLFQRKRSFYYYTAETAGHEIEEIEVEPGLKLLYAKKKDDDLETVDLKDIEIFQSGMWEDSQGRKNGWSDADMDDTVRNFQAMTADGWKIPVKLGHKRDQSFIQREGYPAAGWIADLRRKGKSLVCDFKNVPKRLAKLIKAKAYASISSELAKNLKDQAGRVYKNALVGVALLGEELPALNTLKDIEALYKAHEFGSDGDTVIEVYSYSLDTGVDAPVQDKHTDDSINAGNTDVNNGGDTLMTDEEKRAMRDQVKAELEAEFKAKLEAADAEADKARKEAEEKDAEVAKFKAEEAERAAVELEKATNDFKALLGNKIEPKDHDDFIADFKAQDEAGRKRMISMFQRMPDASALGKGNTTTDQSKKDGKVDPMQKVNDYVREHGIKDDDYEAYKLAVLGTVQYEQPKMMGGGGGYERVDVKQ